MKKKSIIVLIVALAMLVLSAVIGSAIQTHGWTASIAELSSATNSGTVVRTNADGVEKTYNVTGSVTSGTLIIPKNATKENPAPAIVFTHGVYNNKEMQEEFAIELARRGFVTLMIDREGNGNNDDSSMTSGDVIYAAAKYLYNLTDNNGNRIVDAAKIGIAGHSFAGMVIAGALKLDSPEGAATTVKMKQSVRGVTSIVDTAIGAQNDETALSAGYHLGIISSALAAGCSTSSYAPGSSIIALGDIKANSDDMYDTCTTNEPKYIPIAKNTMTSYIFKQGVDGTYQPTATADGHLYYKKGDSYIAVTASDNFKKSKQYYKLDTAANSTYYMESQQVKKFVGVDTTTTGRIVNGGIYDVKTGDLLAQPAKEISYVTQSSKLQSYANKGQQLATDGKSIRVYYEFKGIHQFCTFSTATAAAAVDFFYAAYGVPAGAKYMAASNQTWQIKEVLGGLGIVALFILIIYAVELALSTKFFSPLKAKEGEVVTGAPIYKNPVNAVFYWLTFVITAVFGAWFYCYKLDATWPNSLTKKLIVGSGDNSNYLYGIFTHLNYERWAEVWRFAYWGVVCALFAVVLTVVFWCIKRLINRIVYKDNYAAYDENPFTAFKIRGWKEAGKTVLLTALIVFAFYLVVFGVQKLLTYNYQIFTLNLRTFKLNRLPSYLTYAPFFVIFWVVNTALGANYRVKDMPEWLTVTLNVLATTLVFMIIIAAGNAYYINVGVVANNTVWKNFCYAYPLIPLNALCTIVGRRVYAKTGNAWLAGLICGILCAIIACANQSLGLGI